VKYSFISTSIYNSVHHANIINFQTAPIILIHSIYFWIKLHFDIHNYASTWEKVHIQYVLFWLLVLQFWKLQPRAKQRSNFVQWESSVCWIPASCRRKGLWCRARLFESFATLIAACLTGSTWYGGQNYLHQILRSSATSDFGDTESSSCSSSCLSCLGMSMVFFVYFCKGFKTSLN
jgi:hypothetical protein